MTKIEIANIAGYNRTETIDRWERSEIEGLNRRRFIIEMGARLFKDGITDMDKFNEYRSQRMMVQDERIGQYEDFMLCTYDRLLPFVKKVKK